MSLISFIQEAHGTGSVSSTATTGAITTTSHNTLFAVICQSNAGGTWTITDTNKNSWVRAITANDGSNQVDIWYALNITGGASHTVTATTSNSAVNVTLSVGEFSGLSALIKADVTKSATGTGTTASSGASVVTNQTNEVVITGCFNSSGVTAANSPFSNISAPLATGALNSGSGYNVITTTGAQTATFAVGTGNYGVALATFAVKTALNPIKLRPHAFSPGLAR